MAPYLRLAEGPEDLLGAELSLTRRLLTLFVAFVLLSATSPFATAALDLDQALIGKAIAATGKGTDGDADDPVGRDDEDEDEEDTGASGSSGQGRQGQVTDSGTDDNHNGAPDSHGAGQRARR